MTGQPRQSAADLVRTLMFQLQSELEAANKVGNTTPKAEVHLMRARNLKQRLMSIQQQFQLRKDSSPTGSVSPTPSNASPVGLNATGSVPGPNTGASGVPGPNQMNPGSAPVTNAQMQLRMAQIRQQQLKMRGAVANQQQPAAPTQRTVNMNSANGFQQRSAQAEDLRRHHIAVNARIEQHEQALRLRTDPVEIERLQQQLHALKQRREMVLMRERQLMSELRQALDTNGPNGAAPQIPPVAPVVPNQAPGARPAANMQSQMLRGLPRGPQGQQMQPAQVQAARNAQLRTLQRVKTEVDEKAKAGPIMGSGRQLSESLTIPNQLNVPPVQPSPMRPGRPTLTGGNATSSHALNAPGLVRAPAVDISGERLLSKRKLSDLVTSIVGEDNEPLIDGDVEELLLDLADEFVSNVTSYACKLAKHRKSDTLEAKDIHMHLERNWNMHIAGYSSDEIRSIRRFLPAPAYQQKLQSILMAKSVQK